MENTIEQILEYSDKVLSGQIKASKAVKRAVKRFLKDLEDIDNGKSEFYFDINDVHDFKTFASLFRFTEGKMAGQPVELADFQLFIVANIFGFKRISDGERRYRRAYIQLARKQAKSYLLAMIMAYDTFLADEKRQGYIAGVKSEQSKIVYNQILDILRSSPVVSGKYKETYGRITIEKSGSVIRPLSKEDGRKGDGLFPAVAVIDELHLHKTSEIYDVLLSGQVGQKSPLIVAITTAGLDLTTFGYQEYKYVKEILDPESPVQNEEYFVFIAEYDEEDDWTDPENFEKANPLTVKLEGGIEDLESRLQVALDVPNKKREFLTKHLNIWVADKQENIVDVSKISPQTVDSNTFSSLLEESSKVAYIGVDLSKRFDLTSIAILVPKGEKIMVHSHSFAPQDRVGDLEYSDLVPYRDWSHLRHMTLTPGDVVDYSYVQKYIEDYAREHDLDIELVCLDPWNATTFALELEKAGLPTIEVAQSFSRLSPAIKELQAYWSNERFIIEENEVLKWAFHNAIERKDQNDNILITKEDDRKRIDPVAAFATGFSQAYLAGAYESVSDAVEDMLDDWGW